MSALEGKVVIITGAGGGIGRSVAERFVAEGARVVAVDLMSSVEELAAAHKHAIVPVVGSVADWETNLAAARAARDTWGRIDVFIGNAGVTDAATPLAAIEGDSLREAFNELFAVNVLAPLLGARAALDDLIKAHGSIILTSSFAGSHAAGGGILYTPSKHAVHGIVRQLAYELAPDVRVNGVAPGVAPTRLRGLASLGQGATDSVYDGTELVLPLQVVPKVDDFGGIFAFLADPSQSGAMTGTVVDVDSGLGVRGLSKPGGRVGVPDA